MLDITPLFLAVGALFSLVLILLRTWYYEDIGFIFLGLIFVIASTTKFLLGFLYLGLFFVMLGFALAFINLFASISNIFMRRKVRLDLFHSGRKW